MLSRQVPPTSAPFSMTRKSVSPSSCELDRGAEPGEAGADDEVLDGLHACAIPIHASTVSPARCCALGLGDRRRPRAGRGPTSRSSGEMTSGGASRIVEPWVSLASTPRAISASQTIRPVPIPGSMSTPAHSPRVRTPTTPWPSRVVEPLAQQHAELGGAGLELAGAEHLDHGEADRAGQRVAAEGAAVLAGAEHAEDVACRRRSRRPGRCRRRAPCRGCRCRGRRPRGRRRRSCRCGRGRTGSRRRRTARRAACRARGRRAR